MRGHSLIEILLVLAVVGILFTAALPSFAGFVADQRRTATVNQLVAALHHARHASVTLSRPHAVCPDGDAGRCGADWSRGWIVFTEPRGWHSGRPVPDDAVLYRSDPPHPATAVASNRAVYRFRPHRRRATNGTVVVCEPRRAGRAVIVAPSGRVRTTADLPAWAVEVCDAL